jgi:hypothetical protein
MIIDSRLNVSRMQALTGTSAVASTDTIDLGSTRLIGPGEAMWWVIVARVGLGGTTPTMTISIQTDDNSAFSSAATLDTAPTLAAAAFATGQKIILPMPWTNERHLRLSYTMGGTSPTCTVDAFLTNLEPESWIAYPNAI